MIGDLARFRAHQERWAQFKRWEETHAPDDHAHSDPTARLRWCDEALAVILAHAPTPAVHPGLDDEQVRQWSAIRARLPRCLPAANGAD